MSTEDRGQPSRAWWPIVPFVAGLGLLSWSLVQVEPGYHFCPDSTLKEYNLRLWLRHGNLSNQIDLPEIPLWAHEIWRDGSFPIQSPFEYERKIVFPPFFPLMTLPFYWIAGYAGLFVLPALSIVALWILMWRHWNRSGLAGLPAVLGMTMLALSPLTFYGAMFWEHAPAIFLSILGYTIALAGAEDQNGGGVERWRMAPFMGGFAAVLAQAMRPELVFWTAATLVLGAVLSRGRMWFMTGCAVSGLLCAALNTAATGHPLGIHHEQPRYMEKVGILQGVLDSLGSNLATFFTYTPAACVAVLITLPVIWLRRGARLERGSLLAAFFLSLLALPFVLPNLGDFSIYRRYFLMLIPASAMLAARLAKDWPRLGWALLALEIASLASLSMLAYDYSFSCKHRIKPLREEIEAAPPKAVITYCPEGTLELMPLGERIPFFMITWREQILPLVERIAAHVPPQDIALLFTRLPGDSTRTIRSLTLKDGRTYFLLRFEIGTSIFCLYRLLPSDEVSNSSDGATSAH